MIFWIIVFLFFFPSTNESIKESWQVKSISTLKVVAYWSGSNNTDWENPGNWYCGAVPDKNTDVLIEAGKPNYPEINCNRACRSVSAAAGTSVRVKLNKLLLLTGQN